jgi:transcriptional regulator with XRE-family HTH domain
MDLKEFGKQALIVRENCGFTREEVKSITGISVETLRRLERGIPEPKLSTLENLSNLYRFDLLALFAETRHPFSLFSESMVKLVNEKLNTLDYEGLIELIDHAFEEIALSDSEEVDNNTYYKHFLEALRGIRIKEVRDGKTIIVNVENILLALSGKNSKLLHTPYLYPFEVTVAIYLATLYRRNKECERSIEFCQHVLEKINQYPVLGDRVVDQIGALYQAIAYAFHIMDQHEKVIETIDLALFDRRLAFTNTLYVDMIMRKAVAYYYLNRRESYDLFTVAILNSTGERRKVLLKSIVEQYGIDHHLRNELDY